MKIELISESKTYYYAIEEVEGGIRETKGKLGGKLKETTKENKTSSDFTFRMAIIKALDKGYTLYQPIDTNIGTLETLFMAPYEKEFHVPADVSAFDYDVQSNRFVIGRNRWQSKKVNPGYTDKIEIIFYNAATNESEEVLSEKGALIYDVILSPDSSFLLYVNQAASKWYVKFLDLATRTTRELGVADWSLRYGSNVYLDDSGKRIAFISGHKILVRDLEEDKEIFKLRFEQRSYSESISFTLSPQGNKLAFWYKIPTTDGEGYCIDIYDIADGNKIREIKVLPPEQILPERMAFDKSEKCLLLACFAGMGGFFAWEINTGKQILKELTMKDSYVHGPRGIKYPDYLEIAVLDDGEHFLLVGYHGIFLYSLTTGKLVNQSSYTGNFDHRFFNIKLKGKTMLTSEHLNSLALWKLH